VTSCCPHRAEEHSDEGCLHGWVYYIDDDTRPSMVETIEGCDCTDRGPLKLKDVPIKDLRSYGT
jgi:hypothetical protein